jgi:hypothetical protein
MMRLIKVTLATMAAWDTVRRISPVEVPALPARAAAIGLAYGIEKLATDKQVTALAAVGAGLIIGAFVPSPEAKPWLEQGKNLVRSLSARWRKTQEDHPKTISPVGRRIPKLPV